MRIINLIMLFLLLFSSTVFAKEIINPLTFSGSQSEKNAVISFIETNVEEMYCGNELLESMCTNSLLRMMEEEELSSFKKLTNAKNPKILKNVINTYCYDSFLEGFCNYTMILMMYEEEASAAGKKLEW